MCDCQNPLLSPVAKLDIRDLIEESPSPRSRTTQPSAFSRSSSFTSPHTQYSHRPSSSASCSLSHYSAGTAPPNPFGRQPAHGSQQLPPQPPPPLSNTAQAVFQQNPGLNPAAASAKRPPPSGSHSSDSSRKNRGKWTPAEDAKIIVLRGRGMKWDDISVEIPGRSAISCRLHYQNYLEKRADWDEEQRNKLARVYDRLKSDLWNPIATELGVPWRACEAMHWALGEADMCRRAHVLPFPMATSRPEPASAPAPSAGRVAQRDRMRGSTRVFEGRDITTITSPAFHSVNGNGNAQGGHGPPYAGIPSPMSLPAIGTGHGFPGYEEEEEQDDDDNDDDDERRQEGPRVRRRRLGSATRLPGVAELDRTIAADLAASSEAGRRVKLEEPGRRVKHEHDRRGSGGSGGSGASRRSR
ncbi:hypothetical protein HO133_003602 [Letharia lupina]|uniref:Uncharacterized protein n=1 Tax=Letharia lupina TaxID=560253 RepID=A0A8H6CA86_9LECA|nr:uncharacterized protein HO133_003602 [Letharia lupina]KAF6219777.1 hypothetical protein HO133_003602 [Letharia lupina]